jgi:hypothetical protein
MGLSAAGARRSRARSERATSELSVARCGDRAGIARVAGICVQVLVEGALQRCSGGAMSIIVAFVMSVWRFSEAKIVATYGSARRAVRSAILSTKFVWSRRRGALRFKRTCPRRGLHSAGSKTRCPWKNCSASCGDHAERYFILLQAILKSICREKPVRPWIGGLRVAEANRWFA